MSGTNSMRLWAGWSRTLFRSSIVPLLVCFAALLGTSAIHSQSTFGSIGGTVTDSTGAVIPGAAVTITNLGTNEKRAMTTDANGNYNAVNLPPGTYRADVEMTGFKHFTRQPILVQVGGAVRIDMPMATGDATETITVTTDTPQLQSESAALSQVVNQATVQEMPLNGRNILNLLALVPGVVPQGYTDGASASNAGGGHTQSAGFNNYQIGGALAGQSASFIDGAPLNSLGGNMIILVPTQDAISEFRVSTSDASVEFGRYAGGVTNYSTKAGTNSFHGSAYEYFRNKVLNNTDFFVKRNKLPKAAYQQNQWGATAGGPVLKDKAFFFGSYEGFKNAIGQTQTNTVPTIAERSGDFTAAGEPKIYDPNSSYTGRTQFSDNGVLNKIPASKIDDTANRITNVLKWWPAPNGGTTNSFTSSPVTGSKTWQITGRGDYNLSDKQHLFARYTYWSVIDNPINPFGNETGQAGADIMTHQGVIGDDYVLSPTTIFAARFSVSRSYMDDLPPSLGRDMSVFGPAYTALATQVSAKFNITPSVQGLYGFAGMQLYDKYYRNSVALTPNVTLIRGKHTIKTGADLRFMDFNTFATNNFTGSYSFTPAWTADKASGATSGTGSAFASFLAGTPNSGSINTVHPSSQYIWYQGFFGEDTWQLSRKLTLSLGVRYDLPGTWHERHNLATVLLTNLANPIGSNATKGGLAFVNTSNWAPSATEELKKTLFSPRIGLSYSPWSDTQLRAGYALVYLPMDSFWGAMPFLSPINLATTSMVTSVNNAGQVPQNTLSNPFPAGILQPSGRSQSYLNSLNGLSISGPVPHIRYPYVQQWTTSIQHQFQGSLMLQIAYAGSRGTFLPQGTRRDGSTVNLNELSDKYDICGTDSTQPQCVYSVDNKGYKLTDKVTNPFYGLSMNTTGSLAGQTISFGQLLRPFPQFLNVVQTNAKGDNIYHSLQVSMEKRFHSGGVLQSNYTWAKNIGNVAGGYSPEQTTVGGIQNYNNIAGERSIINWDARHRLVGSMVLPLPFGHGGKYLADATGVLGGLVSGWTANTIVSFQTGFPISLTASANSLGTSWGAGPNTGSPAGAMRPDYVPTASGCNDSPRILGKAYDKVGKWFNTACFAAPASFAFGNEPRVDGRIRMPGIANYDLSVSKSTGITERVKLQMRVEFFNLFNRTQFMLGSSATTVGTTTFGIMTDQRNKPRLMQLSARFNF